MFIGTDIVLIKIHKRLNYHQKYVIIKTLFVIYNVKVQS